MNNRLSPSDLIEASLINTDRIAEDIGNTLVLAPHPDDESLGCGGLIAMLTEAQKKVIVIFVTNGSASHLFSKEYPAEKLAVLRRIEAINACLKLGVHEQDIYFLGAEDGKLSSLKESELDEIVTKIQNIAKNVTLQSLLFPWRRDPHPDHVVTYKIGELFLSSSKQILIRLEYSIWLWKNGKPENWPQNQEVQPVRLNIGEYKTIKKQAINEHKSQLGQVIKDDPEGFVLTKELLEPFMSTYEYFFTNIDRNMNSLSKSYFEQLYKESRDPWNFKKSNYEKEKYEHSIAAIDGKKFEHALEIGCSIGIQTNLLADHCNNLLAIDISEIAIEEAKQNNKNKENISFEVVNIAKDFPKGTFDLITFCEVGYYLDKSSLLNVLKKIDNSLSTVGTLLIVHWRGFVPEYPLSGDDVHLSVQKFLTENEKYVQTKNHINEQYRLEVWEKKR